MSIRPTFTLVTYDTSLGAGYLSADWVPRLAREMRSYPECIGPAQIFCMGHGGWTSNDLLAGAPQVAGIDPTHIFTEGGAINDCPDFGSGPAVSRATAIANKTAMINIFKARNPAVDITMMTMSSVSAAQTARANLAAYYADEMALADSLGIGKLDLFAGWPKPLDGTLTHGAVPWGMTPTSGFPGIVGLQWNPAAAAPAITLDAAGRIIKGNGRGTVLGNVTPTSKLHFEFTFDAAAPQNEALGLATAGFDLGGLVGQGPDSIGIFPGGTANPAFVYLDAGGTLSLIGRPFVIGLGDTVGVEYDPAAHLVWFMKAGVRSPAYDVSAVGGALLPAASVNATGLTSVAQFTNEGDGLHPDWPAVSQFSFPSWRALLRSKMAAFWAP